MIVCLAANPSIDRLFEVDRLTVGGIHRPLGFVQTAGGKGLNVARSARALGAETVLVALLRGHSGRWLAEQLAAEGVAMDAVWTHGESRSSISVADRETWRLTEFYEHGAEVSEASWVDVQDTLGRRLAEANWLTISGSMPLGAPDHGYREVVQEARAASVRVMLDAEGDRLGLALEAGPDVVKVNATEAAELLQVPTSRRQDALTAAMKLRELAGGSGHAGVVTRGAEGVVVAAPDGSLYEGVLYVRGRYPVGSGDAFLAGLVVELDRGNDWPRSLAGALGAAAANAELPGAGRLDPIRADALAADSIVSEL